MSIAELIDHGAPHPWANLRINNLAVEGIIDSPNTLAILPITMGGPFLDIVVTIIFYKIGRTITVNIPDIQSSAAGGAGGTPINSSIGAIPADFLPLFIGGLS